MARGIIRKPSFNKIVGAYRSQWKRFWMRIFTFGIYGGKGIGWWKNPKKAWYNFWYYRTSVSIYRILGCKPSRGASFLGFFVASIISIFAAPVDATRAGVKSHKIKKERKAREEGRTTRATTAQRTTTSTTESKTRTGNTTSSSPKSYTIKTSRSDGEKIPSERIHLRVTINEPQQQQKPMLQLLAIPQLLLSQQLLQW